MNVRVSLLAALCVVGCSSSSTESSSGASATDISGTWSAGEQSSGNGGTEMTEHWAVFGTDNTMKRYTRITTTVGGTSTKTLECANGIYSLSSGTLAYQLAAKDFQGTEYKIEETAGASLSGDKLTITRNVDASTGRIVIYGRGTIPDALPGECPQ